MTDVEAKTPNKRRLSDKGEKKGPTSAKKAKVTPQKPQNKVLSKQSNVQNNKTKFKKNKTNSESENGSPKKLKPFVGTSKIEKPNKQQQKGGKDTEQNAEKSKKKKRRSNMLTVLRRKLESDEKEATLKQIEEKIKAIESQDAITKTAKRKLRSLQGLQKYARGETGGQTQQQKAGSNKAGKKKGTEAVKVLQSNVGKKAVAITQVKGVQRNANDLNKKQVKVDSKQVLKRAKQQLKVVEEESSDEDEQSDDELNQDSGSDEEVEEEEDRVEGEEDEDSDDEDQGDDDEESDEEEGEEEEDSDESEDDSPPPQVSNKRQKKK